MAESYTGKVAWSSEEGRYYAIPDDVEDKNVNPADCDTVIWIDEAPDDDEDGSGHFELAEVPNDLSTLEDTEAAGGSDAE